MIVAEEEWCAEQLVKMASRIGRYYCVYMIYGTCTHACTFSHSFTHSPTHPLTHSLTHSLQRNTLKPELELAAKEMHDSFDKVHMILGNRPPPA
jgi:hypothetical protein